MRKAQGQWHMICSHRFTQKDCQYNLITKEKKTEPYDEGNPSNRPVNKVDDDPLILWKDSPYGTRRKVNIKIMIDSALKQKKKELKTRDD